MGLLCLYKVRTLFKVCQLSTYIFKQQLLTRQSGLADKKGDSQTKGQGFDSHLIPTYLATMGLI